MGALANAPEPPYRNDRRANWAHLGSEKMKAGIRSRTLAPRARDYAEEARRAALAGGRDKPVNLLSAEGQSPAPIQWRNITAPYNMHTIPNRTNNSQIGGSGKRIVFARFCKSRANGLFGLAIASSTIRSITDSTS